MMKKIRFIKCLSEEGLATMQVPIGLFMKILEHQRCKENFVLMGVFKIRI